MSAAVLSKGNPIGSSPNKTAGEKIADWFIRNKFYFLAFAVPVLVMYIAYAIFKVSPWGDNSVLVLDLNGQYVYYFESIRDAFWGDESIFYNWSRNLSGGYAGVIGYYLASPFTLIPILLPRTMLLGSLQIMILTKIGLASVTMSYYLQKAKNMKALPATVFGSLYALCAYGVIQAMDPMWLDGVYLLPLVILGVEYMVDDGRKLNLIIPLAMIFVFNFYIGYIVGIFTVIYFLFYVISGRNEKNKIKSDEYLKIFGRFGICGAVALMLSAFMLLMVYNALKLGKFDFTEPDFSFKTQFNPLDFFPQLLPAQYDTVNVEGLPEIYCGVLTVVMLPLFYLSSKISVRKKIGYTAILLVLFLCMYIRPIDMVWHGFQMPNWLPFRYSFTFSFTLVVMGAMAYKNIKDIKPSAIGGAAFVVLCFLAVAASRNSEHITTGEIAIAGVFALVYVGIVFLFRNKEKALAVAAPVMLMAVCSGEQLYNCYTTFTGEDGNLVYSKAGPYYNFINNGRAVIEQLNQYNYDNGNENDGFYRADKTFHRTVNDAGAMGMRGISHSSSVMNAKILSFLEALGFSSSSYYSRFDGDTPITDAVLGVKYSLDKIILDDNDAARKTNEVYEPVFSYNYKNEDDKDTRIDVFKNPYALSLGFMSDENIMHINALGNDNTFNSQNIMFSTIAGHTDVDLQQGIFSSYYEYFKPMNVNPDDFVYSEDTIEESTYPSSNPDHPQRMYTAKGDGDPVVNMHITPTTDDPIYFYFQTENQKSVNLWLSTEKDENGNYTGHKFVGSYFENHDYHTIDLGKFEPGKEFELRMTVANEYTIVNNFLFYQFDEELFKKDIEKLKQNQWNITEFDGDYIKGDITAEDGQFMLTSIPYEEGWKIKVDGETLDFYDKDAERSDFDSAAQCYTVFMKALIGVKLTPGQHTIEMSYTPPGLIPGLGLFLAGIACVVLIYRYDKKNNKILLAKKRGIKEPQEEEASDEKKGKGKKAKAEEDIRANEADAEDTSEQKSKSQKKNKKKKAADKEENAPMPEQTAQQPEAKAETSVKSGSGFFIDAVMPDDIEHEEALRRLAEAEAKLKVLEDAEAKLKALEEREKEREQNKNKKGRGKKKKK